MITTLKELFEEYERECDIIAEECEAEGYPSHGSNYDLRCEALWDNHYKWEYDEILRVAKEA